MTKKLQRYEGRDITVFFDPGRCMHAGKCVRELPEVFKPDSRGGWIFPNEAEADSLAAMVLACPSGALTCELNGKLKSGIYPASNKITVMPDGALYIHAEMSINGEEQPTFRAALCRCGKTSKPPYCDNSHKKAGFKDAARQMQGDIEDVATDGKLEVVAIQDGPLMVRGGCEVRNVKGEVVARGRELFLCRCGASEAKPFCDGSHNRIAFRSD
jgi:CDGSH-type Zn-finger protein/uncharacterized Fe-S cluster protein YjdI